MPTDTLPNRRYFQEGFHAQDTLPSPITAPAITHASRRKNGTIRAMDLRRSRPTRRFRLDDL